MITDEHDNFPRRIRRLLILVLVLVVCILAGVRWKTGIVELTGPVPLRRVSPTWPGTPNADRDKIREMGTNAVPWLISEMERQPLFFRTWYHKFHQKVPYSVGKYLPAPPRDQTYLQGTWMLGELGPMASNAIPTIERLRSRVGTTLVDVKAMATVALAKLQPQSAAAASNLVAAFKSSQQTERFYAAMYAGSLPNLTEEESVALLAALKDVDGEVRANACWSVAQFGAKLKEAAPQLKTLFADKYRHVSSAAAYALVKVAPENISEACDVIVTNIQVGTEMVATYAPLVFLESLPPATNAIPFLESCLVAKNSAVPKQVAAIALWRITREHNGEIIRALEGITMAQEVRALSALGTNAVPAIPILERLARSGDRELRAAAQEALARIRGEGNKFQPRMDTK